MAQTGDPHRGTSDSHGYHERLRRGVESGWQRLRPLLVRLRNQGAGKGLLSLGIVNPIVVLCSVALTYILFLCWNLYLTAAVDETYESYVVPELQQAVNPDEAARICVEELEWASDAKSIWLTEFFDKAGGQPAHVQLLKFINLIVVSDDDRRREDALHHRVTGARHWTAWLTVASSPTTGRKVFDEQLAFNNGLLRNKLRGDQEAGGEKKRFAVALSNRLVDAVNEDLRNLMRLNGFIQWLTILLAMLLLCLVARRILLLRPFKNRWTAGRFVFGDASSEPASGICEVVRHMEMVARSEPSEYERMRVVQEEMAAFRLGMEAGIYGSLGYLVSLLPSLGFIGTVWGMGKALLQADQLMTAVDQQSAIKSMTEQLGYAFDTTLVALAAAVVVGIAIAALKRYEEGVYERCTRDLKREFIKPAAARATVSDPVG